MNAKETGEDLGSQVNKLLAKARPKLAEIEAQWFEAGHPAESVHKEAAKALLTEVMRDVMKLIVKTCVRHLVLGSLEVALRAQAGQELGLTCVRCGSQMECDNGHGGSGIKCPRCDA